MAEKGRYLKAMGLESYALTKIDLTPEGAMLWGASKVPAALGGRFADWVYGWALKKWPNTKRGADFTGGVCVVVAAYGLQVLVTRYQASYGGIIDKFTDGMIGRMSSVIWGLFSGLFDSDKGKRSPGAAQTPAASSEGTPPKRAQGIDGDRESVQDVAAVLHSSPETTQQIADQMFAIMRQEGVKIDDAGREAVVRSMRQATQNFAAGNF